MISTKDNRKTIIMISLILISLTAIFTFGINDVSAINVENISSNTSQTTDIQTTVEKSTTESITNNQSIKTFTNTSKSNQTSSSKSENDQKLPDPQIYRNGVPVSRGGHPAGYVFNTIAHAITDAQSGDTIMLEDGAVFYERITISKNLIFDVFNNGHATIDGSSGGRIFDINSGYTVTFNNIIFANGRVTGGGDGGAIRNYGTLTINGCTFTNNYAVDEGGAIRNYGTLTVTNTIFTSNSAGDDGGAIYNSGTLTVTGSNFSGNSASDRGGAIYNAAGTAEIHFNRIVGNTPTNNQVREQNGAVNANNNWWGSNSGPGTRISGFTVSTYLILTITASNTFIPTSGASTITADLTHDNAGNYYNPASGHVPDGIQVAFSGTLGSVNPIDVTTNNGIATTTFTAGSTAGTATIQATADSVSTSTQISVGMGRYDVYVSTTGSDTTGNGSLGNPYQTISKGISMVYPGGTVHILSGTYTGTSNRNIAISKNVNIIGEGGIVTINAQSASTIFTVNSGYTVTMSNLTLANGAGTNGGAINNAGNLTVDNCTFTGNSGSYGGAIWNTMTLTVTNCTFTDNTASADGGGICTGNGSTDPVDSTVTVTNCTFTSNTANWGGAIWNRSPSLTVSGCTFISNSATSYGGAIRNWGNSVVTGNTFTGNSATTGGASISTYNGGSTVAHFNRLIGNGANEIHLAVGSVDATNNWWGSNTSPSGKVDAGVDVSSWLILTITANPDSIRRNGISTLTTYLIINSNGVDTSSLGYLPDGITVTFGNDTLGTINPLTNTTSNSQANSTFTAGNTPGVTRVSATVDGVTVYTDIIIGNIANLTITNNIAYEDSVIYLHDTGLFHIKVHNIGADDATGVRVAITIPSGFQLIAVNPIIGAYDSSTNTWTIGNLCYNGTAYLDLILKVVKSGTSLTVTANVTGNEEGTDDIVSKTVNILKAADLEVTQTVTNNTPNTGSNITSTVTIKNNGPDTANNIIIYYMPPSGLNIISINPSVGSYNPTTGYWTINSLALNGTATLTITATVTAPSGTIIKNTAKAIKVDEINYSYNNANTTIIRVGGVSYTPQTDLEIYNYYYNIDQDTVDGTVQLKLKDTAMFYVDLHNKGPDDATGVKVTLTIPAGYYILAVNPKIGTFDYNTNTWTIDNLSSGGWALLDYIVKIIQSNTTLNSTVNATGNETDTNSTNNNESAVINVPPAADLQVNQTVNNTQPTQGSTVTYVVTVTNNGPNTANDTAINYTTSTGLNIVSITPSAGTNYNSSTGEWTIGSLGVGGSATLTITATVTAPSGTIIKSIATRIREEETDPNLTDISKTTYLQVQ